MAVDLGFTALVNAAGGLLFFFVGVAIFLLGRATRTGRALGAFATVFGAHYVVNNVYYYSAGDPDRFAGTLGIALATGTGLLAMLVARDELRSASRRARRLVIAIGLVAFALIAASFAVVITHRDALSAVGAYGADPLAAVYDSSLFFGDIGLLILLAAGVQRVRAAPADAPRERRAAILRTLAFGLYIVFFVVANAVRAASPALRGADLANWLGLAYGLVPVVCVLPLLGATPEEPKLARRALLALLSAGLLGVVMTLASPADGGGFGDFGAYGIVRTVGVVLLAIAVLRYDLLGVPLPRLVRRGSLATGALAVLLIVTQVAQNFLTAQYSLLMGGIVSGALIFAATPIQRAMERRREDDPRGPDSVAVLTYRAALRAALEDGTMTPREEEHLAEVAHHLRLSPVDALRLRRDLERELGHRRD